MAVIISKWPRWSEPIHSNDHSIQEILFCLYFPLIAISRSSLHGSIHTNDVSNGINSVIYWKKRPDQQPISRIFFGVVFLLRVYSRIVVISDQTSHSRVFPNCCANWEYCAMMSKLEYSYFLLPKTTSLINCSFFRQFLTTLTRKKSRVCRSNTELRMSLAFSRTSTRRDACFPRIIPFWESLSTTIYANIDCALPSSSISNCVTYLDLYNNPHHRVVLREWVYLWWMKEVVRKLFDHSMKYEK